MITPVEDPSKYGVVIAKENGQIERFVEKPQVYVSNKINAGLYLFNVDMIDRIPNEPTSIERAIFPVMASDEHLYQMELPGYWMDIGQPKDYLSGQAMYLKSRDMDVMVHETAKVDSSAQLGPNVVIGPGCEIGAGVKISNSTILGDTKVKPHTLIQGSIIGWKNTIGSWVRITKLTCTAEDVQVKDESLLENTKILPHKGVTGEYRDQIIM